MLERVHEIRADDAARAAAFTATPHVADDVDMASDMASDTGRDGDIMVDVGVGDAGAGDDVMVDVGAGEADAGRAVDDAVAGAVVATTEGDGVRGCGNPMVSSRPLPAHCVLASLSLQ